MCDSDFFLSERILHAFNIENYMLVYNKINITNLEFEIPAFIYLNISCKAQKLNDKYLITR
jgi:hypothetical protein